MKEAQGMKEVEDMKEAEGMDDTHECTVKYVRIQSRISLLGSILHQ